MLASPIVGFHAQQATEKLLKAWLAILGIEYPLTHSIARLLRLIGNQDLAALRFKHMHEFSPFARHFRYGSVTRELSRLDRKAAVARIDDLLRAVRATLDSARGARESRGHSLDCTIHFNVLGSRAGCHTRRNPLRTESRLAGCAFGTMHVIA